MTGSSPTNGSSISSTAGSWRIAAISWTFCWLPFELLGAAGRVVGDAGARASPARAGRDVAGAIGDAKNTSWSRTWSRGYSPALLGEVAPRLAGHLGGGNAEPRHRAGIRPQDVEDDPHRRGLAGAVGTEEPEDWPLGTSNEMPSSAVTAPNRLTRPSRTRAPSPLGYVAG